jgi:hypothetical protein
MPPPVSHTIGDGARHAPAHVNVQRTCDCDCARRARINRVSNVLSAISRREMNGPHMHAFSTTCGSGPEAAALQRLMHC